MAEGACVNCFLDYPTCIWPAHLVQVSQYQQACIIGAGLLYCYCTADCLLAIAALGHLDVLKAVVEVLQNSAADVAGCQGSENIKEPSINMLTWGRFVKDVINARTSAGKTPLMLACEKGCGNSTNI